MTAKTSNTSIPTYSTPGEAFLDAERFRLRLSLQLSPAERLRDLEAMLQFNEAAEARNPRLRWIAERLRAAGH